MHEISRSQSGISRLPKVSFLASTLPLRDVTAIGWNFEKRQGLQFSAAYSALLYPSVTDWGIAHRPNINQ
jgi:hypothetical protein